MVTKEFDAKTKVPYWEYKVVGDRRRRISRYFIGREANAFTVLLFGLGFLFFVIGVCTHLYPVGYGVVGWFAFWVLATALRVYFGRWAHSDTIDYEN
jgi:hypothetical protein